MTPAIDERTPLLRRESHEEDFPQHSRQQAHGLWPEVWLLLKRTGPVSLGYALQNSVQSISIAMVAASATDTELSAAAHGFMIAMCTAWVCALGGSSALDTLASAAYSRALADPKRHSLKEVGLLLQRCVVLLLLLYLPIAAFWCFCAGPLRAVGQPPLVAEEIQRFLRVLALGAPGYIIFESIKKFCQTQGDMKPPTIVLATLLPVNVILNLVFVRWLGFIGSPIAVGIIYYLAVLLLALYIALFRRDSTALAWAPWSLKAFNPRSCFEFLCLAVPGIAMVGTEWAAFEIVAIASGWGGAQSLAAQSVVMTCDQILNTIPFGLGVAASSRIGNLLGDTGSHAEGSAARRSGLRMLRTSTLAAALLSTLLGALVGLALMLGRWQLGAFFSEDPGTIALVAHVLPLVAAFQIFDGWANSCGGVLRGKGSQHIGAGANLVAYYVCALPLGIWLAYSGPRLGLQGLWVGQVLALGLVGAAEFVTVTRFTDWGSEVEKAEKRGREGGAGDGAEEAVTLA